MIAALKAASARDDSDAAAASAESETSGIAISFRSCPLRSVPVIVWIRPSTCELAASTSAAVSALVSADASARFVARSLAGVILTVALAPSSVGTSATRPRKANVAGSG